MERGIAAAVVRRDPVEAQPRGIFSTAELQHPGDFGALVAGAIARCDAVRSKLATLPSASVDLSTLMLLDSISNEICSVIDVAELVRNVHGDAAFRAEAEKAFSTMASYIGQVNKDSSLYTTLMQFKNNASLWSQLSEEQRILVLDLKREFEAEGIHLQPKDKQRALQLQDEVGSLESQFMQAVACDDDVHTLIGPIANRADCASLKAWLAASRVPQEAAAGRDDYLVATSSKRLVASMLAAIDEEQLRAKVWQAAAAQPAANASILCALVRKRQQLAQAMGYESWAHKVLDNSVAGGPDQVMGFLASTAELTRDLAESDYAVLCDLKRKHGAHGGAGGDVAPWDVAYYCEMHKALSPRVSRFESPQAELSRFLSLGTCLSAVAELSWELFGLRLLPRPLGPSENWLKPEGSSIATGVGIGVGIGVDSQSVDDGDSHSHDSRKMDTYLDSRGALKFLVADRSGAPVGVVYFDLFHRPGKFQGAAHFTVQCGCAHLKTESGAVSGSVGVGAGAGEGYPLQQQHQLPVVALVFNFAPASSSSSSSSSPPSLSLSGLSTLFHEWGHALHSLLSRTTYQHLSGTRAALDFVEVPSHLLERFARDPRLLRRWGRDNRTGAKPSADLVHAALDSSALFSAVEAQSQLLYALADQHLFGPEGARAVTSSSSSSSSSDASFLSLSRSHGNEPDDSFARLAQGVAKLQASHTVFPPTTLIRGKAQAQCTHPSMFLLSHTHLISYGGSYYSYLYAKMRAAQLWTGLGFDAQPLGGEGGRALREGMLAHGAAKDQRGMLEALAGPLDPLPYIRSLSQSQSHSQSQSQF